ncbi:secretion system protein [Halodesulfurarchaeum sp. HSR-GB]|uniref:type II/IV secretion system ATPase subunit n=1 Tax=Halodesulfurarchaeum sp. HSR-GB TaxID=3074077 RepID=UPI002863E93E|nr:secretion system protein [Halodesulfurarchaeum sp. HSR-GB]MDR5656726.1 secretion system protein [Halodesulfurarchaeum sp. HSR-GB]
MSEELPASVPGPVPPDDRTAWYAPAVRSQYAVSNGIVATVSEQGEGYRYHTRTPSLSEREKATQERIERRFEDATISRPRTRAGAVERVTDGLPSRLRDRLPELDDRRPASRRRLQYHLLASLRALGDLTPLALDDRVRIADTNADRLAVHTRDFAPAITDLPDDTPFLDRFLGERLRRETVPFAGFEIPVTVVRGHLLGADTFEVSYVVEEPDLLPGDRALIETVLDRLLESPPAGILDDEIHSVAERARTLLNRRIGTRPLARLADRLPLPRRSRSGSLTPASRSERLDALTYYVLRDLLGDGKLTIPLRDPAVRSVEVNRVGDRITVVSHRGTTVGDTRMPTTLSIDDTAEFVALTRSLAAEGGVELSVHRPATTVTLERDTKSGRREMHCSVSLPDRAERGHVSITAERETPPTPMALVERNQLDPELVAGIWTAAANRGTVVFVGPVDAEPTAALGAHTPFIPAADRPVEIGAGDSQVDLPHETAISVPRRDGDRGWDRRTERDALHPDVAVLSGLNTPEALEQLGSVVASGRPAFAAARAADRSLFAHLVSQAGIVQEFTAGVDLVVELPPPKADETATGWVPVSPDGERAERKPGPEFERLFDTEEDGALSSRFARTLAASPETGVGPAAVAFERRRQYVEYLLTGDSTDRERLMGFLADLRTDEAATIERIRNWEQ